MSGEHVDPLLRWARATLTAGVALTLAAVAHTEAGGRLPALPALLVLAGVTVLACGLLLTRPASTLRLAALVMAAQTGGHLVLTALAGHGGARSPAPVGAAAVPVAPSVPAGRRLGSLHDLTALSPAPGSSGAGTPHWVTHLVEDLSGPHAAMALAHLVAAALLGWWLASGERALWTLISLGGEGARDLRACVRALVRASLRPPVGLVGPRRGAAPTPYVEAAPPPALACRQVTRRGPPRLALAA